MKYAVLAALLLILCKTVYSQVPRYKRWVLLADSSVIAPLNDLRLAYGYRKAQNRRVSNAVREIAALAGQVRTLTVEKEQAEGIGNNERREKEIAQGSLATCNETNAQLSKSNNSLKGWNKGLLAGVAVLTAILVFK